MLRKLVCLCLLWLALLDLQSSFVHGVNNQKKAQQIVSELLDQSKYDKRVRPTGVGGDGPTIVEVNMYVRSMPLIDDAATEYEVQLTFRQQWFDERLRFNSSGLRYVTLMDRSQIWIPDLFFSNEKTSHLHDLMAPNNYIRMFANGECLYSSRITLRLSCPMEFRQFPFDRQVCTMRMASYGYTRDDIIFKWKPDEPVQVTTMYLPGFELKEYTTDTCDSTTNTGVYSCLRANFALQRNFSPWLITVYIPSTMIIIVAWLGCWLDHKSVTARILIALSSLFVLATQCSELAKILPKTSYTKAIDVWTGISLTFVMACLIEFVVVNHLARSEERETPQETPREDANSEVIQLNQKELEIESAPATKKNVKAAAQSWIAKFSTRAEKVDAVFRVCFPIVFLLYCMIYFAVHC